MRPRSGAVQLAFRGPQRLLAAGADRHPGALARERQGDRLPETAAAAADDRGLACQFEIHTPPGSPLR